MLKISAICGRRVLVPKKPKTAKDGTQKERWSKIGRVHMAVFSPDGRRLVGFLVRRPDVAGMVKRDDVYLAWDSFELREKDVVVTRPDDGMDAAARKRLGVAWDACILWAGMDVKTVDGKALGYVSDAEYDETTGLTSRFFSTDGGMANALVGAFSIDASMVRGYAKGCMVIDPGDAELLPEGGLAAKAGEGYARAKAAGAEAGKKAGAVGKKAGEAAGKAVDKGSFELGRLIGKAQRAVEQAASEDALAEQQAPAVAEVPAADVQVTAPAAPLPASAAEREERPEPPTYAPAAESAPAAQPKAAASRPAKKPAATTSAAKKPVADQAARAVGKGIGSLGKMFGGFADEFKKASR